MNKDQILGILRHVLTAIGGALMVSGKADESMVAAGTGAIMTLAGLAWSVWEKSQAK